MANFTPVFLQVSQLPLIKPGSPKISFLPGIGGNSQIGESNTERSLSWIFLSFFGDREIPKIKMYFKQKPRLVLQKEQPCMRTAQV